MARLKDTEINGNLVVKGDLLNKDGVDLTTAFSNPNLLINSDFRNPVNQRGNTSYSADGTKFIYTIDRWKIKNGVVTVKENSISFQNTSSNSGFPIRQTFENPLPAGEYTVSCKLVSATNKVHIKIYKDGTSVKQQLQVGVNSCTFEVNDYLESVEIFVVANATAELEYIKLEQGSIATPFVPRQYGEELALCQRYYEEANVMFIPMNLVGNTTYFMAFNGGDYKVEKRATPTVTFKKFVDNNGNDLSVSASNYAGDTKSFKRAVLSSSISNVYILNTIYADAEIY